MWGRRGRFWNLMLALISGALPSAFEMLRMREVSGQVRQGIPQQACAAAAVSG